MEMLAYRTPPTCIQACLYATAKTLFPNADIILMLPGLTHIKNLRTTLWEVTKTLACYQLGHAHEWKQLHIDETSRRQTSLGNVVISMLTTDVKFKTVCLNSAIICDDGKAESQCNSIISTFTESSKLLGRWRAMTEEMYPARNDLVECIPDPTTMDVTRMIGGGIEQDTCNTALSLGNKLTNAIIKLSHDRNPEQVNAADQRIYKQKCFNHLRNVWLGAVENMLGKKLEAHFKHDLELIPSHLRVACRLSELLLQVDKEYSFTANYAKGSGDDYYDWKVRYRPGKRYLPIIRVVGGNRQDSAFEGALPVYDGLDDMLAFTHECLLTGENLLQRSLFLSLGSMEVVAQLRVASILHISVVVPMRWLAGNTHTLAHREWGERSMGRVIDILYNAFDEIKDCGELFLDLDFMMNIFSTLYEQLPEFKEYLDYFFEQKETNVIGSSKGADRVLGIDEAMVELFMPTKERNRQTEQFCRDLSVAIAITLLAEMEDPKKATHCYLSMAEGEYSQAVISQQEELASYGMRANNDPSEGMFATLTDILCSGGRINLASAAGIGQARYNHDFYRGHEELVGKGKQHKNNNPVPSGLGTFHTLGEELQNSLLACCKKASPTSRKGFAQAIKRQRSARALKRELIAEKKLEQAENSYIQATYLFQQFHSPRCWRTASQAFIEFDKLKTKKDRLRFVKEQILIRYLGLGWAEAHHPWSKNKHVFTSSELLEHLVKVVIPLELSKSIPTHPPVELPKRPDELTLGTKSAGLINLDNSLLEKEHAIRISAMKERDRLESNGLGDQLNEMQSATWPVQKILAGRFKIDMCFCYQDDEGNETLQWCQGIVVQILSDKSKEKNYINVLVKWKDKDVVDGGSNPTKEMLKMRDYNPETHCDRSWREDLHHLLVSADT